MTEMQINSPVLWLDKLPIPQADAHKYHRGHALICAAPELSGATRLAAASCSRIGAGLVTVIADSSGMADANLYRVCLPASIMVRDSSGLDKARQTARVMLCGSGGVMPEHLSAMLEARDRQRVFDADALEAASGQCDELCVLTPHQGEFARCFPDLSGSAASCAIEAAARSGATIVLKGRHTHIASAAGRVVQNRHASPWLAKAGSGDVLSGLITGLLAQSMPIFEACCAAVWIHGEAALRFGPGLVADDLPELIAPVLADLLRSGSGPNLNS